MVVVIMMRKNRSCFSVYEPLIRIKNSILHRIPKPEDNFVALTSMLGASTGSISVDLQTIPNEPIRFMVNCVCHYSLWLWRDLFIG